MHQPATTPPRDLIGALAISLGVIFTHPRFDPPHGGYPGEVVPHDLYLQCTECPASYPFDSLADHEPCDHCGGPVAYQRVHQAPESTIPLPGLRAC